MNCVDAVDEEVTELVGAVEVAAGNFGALTRFDVGFLGIAGTAAAEREDCCHDQGRDKLGN